MHQTQYDSSYGQFTWYPNGTEVTLAIADHTQSDQAHSNQTTGNAVLHLQMFDLSGHPAGTVPLKAPAPSAHAWSPDRRYLVAAAGDPTAASTFNG